jgi:hypothetical protein
MYSFLFLIFCVFVTEGISGQQPATKQLPQYLFSSFLPAELLMKNGDSVLLDLNYNTLTEKMVFKIKEKLYDLVNPGSCDTVYLQNRFFVPFDTVFLDVVTTGKIAFYMQHSSIISFKSKPKMTGTTQVSSSNYYDDSNSGTVYLNEKLPSNFSVKPLTAYWVRKDDKMKTFTNVRQLLKIFPEEADSIKSFIKAENLKISNRHDLIRIGNYCKSMSK